MSKLAAIKLKVVLHKVVSKHQFGFLYNRQIIEPIGIVQEALHTIKVEKQKVMVMKLDLVKAFDKVNWSFLRLVPLQIGIPSTFLNWIMGCVESTNFVVLINGTPSNFFQVLRGIK